MVLFFFLVAIASAQDGCKQSCADNVARTAENDLSTMKINANSKLATLGSSWTIAKSTAAGQITAESQKAQMMAERVNQGVIDMRNSIRDALAPKKSEPKDVLKQAKAVTKSISKDLKTNEKTYLKSEKKIMKDYSKNVGIREKAFATWRKAMSKTFKANRKEGAKWQKKFMKAVKKSRKPIEKKISKNLKKAEKVQLPRYAVHRLAVAVS